MPSTRRTVLRLGTVGTVAATAGCLDVPGSSPRAWQVSTVHSAEPILADAPTESGAVAAALVRSPEQARRRLGTTAAFDPAESGYHDLDYGTYVVSVTQAVVPDGRTLATRASEFDGDALRLTVGFDDAENDGGVESTLVTWDLDGHPTPETVDLQVED